MKSKSELVSSNFIDPVSHRARHLPQQDATAEESEMNEEKRHQTIDAKAGECQCILCDEQRERTQT